MDRGRRDAAAAAEQPDDTSCWNFLDPSFFEEDTSSNPCYFSSDLSVGLGVDFAVPPAGCGDCAEKQFVGKRGHEGGCSRGGVKACRQRLRRLRLNDKYGW